MREKPSSYHTKEKKKKWNTRGFYITLGVCLVAVGMAAWTTYDSITKTLQPVEEPAKQSPVGQTVSGVLVSQSEPQSQASSPITSSFVLSSAPNLVSSTQPSVGRPATSRVESSSQATVSQVAASSAPSTQSTTATVAEPKVFTYPLAKEITKAYSGDNLVYSQTMQDWRVHQGMDLRAKVGDLVKAIAEGKVEDIYEDALLGNVIVISHGTLEARYCGLGDTALVKTGAVVKAGQEIGSVGTVPLELAEEPHLHLELRRAGKLENPEDILTETVQKAS